MDSWGLIPHTATEVSALMSEDTPPLTDSELHSMYRQFAQTVRSQAATNPMIAIDVVNSSGWTNAAVRAQSSTIKPQTAAFKSCRRGVGPETLQAFRTLSQHTLPCTGFDDLSPCAKPGESALNECLHGAGFGIFASRSVSASHSMPTLPAKGQPLLSTLSQGNAWSSHLDTVTYACEPTPESASLVAGTSTKSSVVPRKYIPIAPRPCVDPPVPMSAESPSSIDVTQQWNGLRDAPLTKPFGDAGENILQSADTPPSDGENSGDTLRTGGAHRSRSDMQKWSYPSKYRSAPGATPEPNRSSLTDPQDEQQRDKILHDVKQQLTHSLAKRGYSTWDAWARTTDGPKGIKDMVNIVHRVLKKREYTQTAFESLVFVFEDQKGTKPRLRVLEPVSVDAEGEAGGSMAGSDDEDDCEVLEQVTFSEREESAVFPPIGTRKSMARRPRGKDDVKSGKKQYWRRRHLTTAHPL